MLFNDTSAEFRPFSVLERYGHFLASIKKLIDNKRRKLKYIMGVTFHEHSQQIHNK